MTQQCNRRADYRYTWPASDESYVCEGHSGKLRAVANALGMHLQLIPFADYEQNGLQQCKQQVSEQLPVPKVQEPE